jgi:hypothetical protein
MEHGQQRYGTMLSWRDLLGGLQPPKLAVSGLVDYLPAAVEQLPTDLIGGGEVAIPTQRGALSGETLGFFSFRGLGLAFPGFDGGGQRGHDLQGVAHHT